MVRSIKLWNLYMFSKLRTAVEWNSMETSSHVKFLWILWEMNMIRHTDNCHTSCAATSSLILCLMLARSTIFTHKFWMPFPPQIHNSSCKINKLNISQIQDTDGKKNHRKINKLKNNTEDKWSMPIISIRNTWYQHCQLFFFFAVGKL
jgi:hypothetical protein